MTPVLPDKVFAVTNNPSIVHLIFVSWACSKGLASIETSCPGIGIFCNGGVVTEGLWKTFGTGFILHTGGLLILCTTGAMDHELLNQFKQLRIPQEALKT
jgi:hypothetical protein